MNSVFKANHPPSWVCFLLRHLDRRWQCLLCITLETHTKQASSKGDPELHAYLAIWFSDLQLPFPYSFSRVTVSAMCFMDSSRFPLGSQIVPLNWKAVSLTSWCSAHPRPEHTIANLNGNKRALKGLNILKSIYSKYVVAFFFFYKDDGKLSLK